MVSFNRDVQPVTPPRTVAASRGIPPNRAFETLFRGLGSAATGLAKAADNAQKDKLTSLENQIATELEGSFTSPEANKELSVFDPSPSSTNQQEGPQNVVPVALEDAKKEFTRLERASNQNTVSNTTVMSRVIALAKKHKAANPRLGPQIDAMVGKVLRRSPANALRKAQIQEERRLNSQVEKANNRMTSLRKEGSAVGMTAEELATFENEGSLEFAVRERQSAVSQIKLNNTKLDNAKKRGEAVEKEASSQLTRQLSQALNFGTDRSTAQLFGSRQEYEKRLKEAQDPAGPGGKGFTPEEVEQVVTSLSALEADFQQTFRDIAETPIDGTPDGNTLASMAGGTEAARIQKDFFGRLNRLKRQFQSGDFAAVDFDNQQLKASQSQEDALIRKNAPGIRSLDALKRSVGSEAATQVLISNPKLAKQIQSEMNTMTTNLVSNIDNGPNSTTGGDALNLAKTMDLPPEAHRAIIEKMVGLLEHPQINLEGLKKFSTGIHNGSLLQSIQQYKPDQQKDIFLRFVSPAVTANMTKISKTDPGFFSAYKNFLAEGFKQLYQKDLTALQDSLEGDQNVRFEFNSRTNQFDPVPVRSAVESGVALVNNPFFETLEALQTSAGGEAVQSLNKYLQRLAPIIKAEGGDGRDIQQEFMKTLKAALPRFDPNPADTGSIGGRLLDKILDTLGQSFEPTEQSSQSPTDRRRLPRVETGAGQPEQTEVEVSPLDTPVEAPEASDAVPTPRAKPQDIKDLGAFTEELESLQNEANTTLPAPFSSLRDSIAIGEGTLGGEGYDTILAGAQEKFGVQPTQMTLDEVIAFQESKEFRDFSKQTVGRIATPVGKYQIVGRTLKGLKRIHKLDGNQKFTPAFQDLLFVRLLEGRGLKKFQQGQLSKKAFFDQLKQEWEGLKVNRRSAQETFNLLDEVI